MHATVVSDLLKKLRFRLVPAAHRTDAELLDRFIEARDEAAFETLVLHHGPMVLGVCRRVLSHQEPGSRLPRLNRTGSESRRSYHR